MKAVSVQSGVELRVELQGESWSQGDTLLVSFNVRNLPDEAVLQLCHGSERKLKSKSPDAFEVLEAVQFSAKNSTFPASCEFKLPLNTRITDRNGSIYLVYGLKNVGLKNGPGLAHLKLLIEPHLHLRDLVLAIQTTYRFVQKSLLDAKKGWVTYKLDPPDGKEMSRIESLEITLSINGKEIQAKYEFTLKHVDAINPGLKLIKTKYSHERIYPLNETIHSFNQRLNKGAIEKSFAEVLHAIQNTPL